MLKTSFVLSFLYWMYNRQMENTDELIREKFGKKPDIMESNIKALHAGFNYADTTETFTTRFHRWRKRKWSRVHTALLWVNQALSYGLIAASQKKRLESFPGNLSELTRLGYPS